MHFNRIGRHRHAARPTDRLLAAISQRVELGEEVVPGQLLPDEKLERARINRSGNRPALAGKLLLHHGIEINGDAREYHQGDNG